MVIASCEEVALGMKTYPAIVYRVSEYASNYVYISDNVTDDTKFVIVRGSALNDFCASKLKPKNKTHI